MDDIRPERLYKVEQAAAVLGVSIYSIRRYIKSGALPSRKIGRRYFIPGAALLAGPLEPVLTVEPEQVPEPVPAQEAKPKGKRGKATK